MSHGHVLFEFVVKAHLELVPHEQVHVVGLVQLVAVRARRPRRLVVRRVAQLVERRFQPGSSKIIKRNNIGIKSLSPPPKESLKTIEMNYKR